MLELEAGLQLLLRWFPVLESDICAPAKHVLHHLGKVSLGDRLVLFLVELFAVAVGYDC